MPVEHVVGGVVHHPRPGAHRFLGQDARHLGVEPARCVGLRFGGIHGRVRSGVDDPRGLHRAHGVADVGLTGEIQLRTGGRHHLAKRRQRARQLPPHLPVGAQQQDLHHGTSAPSYRGSRSRGTSASSGAAASLAAIRNGVASCIPGQAIPRLGSSHRTLNSAAASYRAVHL